LETPSRVTGYAIDPAQPAIDQLEECFTGADLLLVPAGVPRKPGMTRDDLFAINAGIAKGIVESAAKYCPNAVLGMIVNPVNSVVPAMAELYKKKGLDPLKVVGVTTLDTVRANKFVAEKTGKSVADIQIPVVGGHAGKSILPLFSQDPVGATLSEDDIKALDPRTQDGGTEVVNAKAGKGSATLSMAYAGARFGFSVLEALNGKKGVVECCYGQSSLTEASYFATPMLLGPGGAEKCLGVGDMTTFEKEKLDELMPELKSNIAKGEKFAQENL